MRVLIQRHRPSVPNREIRITNHEPVRIRFVDGPEHATVLAPREFHREAKRAVRLRRLPERADDREPVADRFAGEDPLGGDGDDADEVCSEHVVVLDEEVDLSGRVRQRDLEVLVPARVLRIGDHAGARDGGAGEADGDVGIAGDDLAVAVAGAVELPFSGDGGAASVERGEEPSDALREQVHVGERASLDDYQIEGPVEVHHVAVFLRHCDGGAVTGG